MSQKSNWQKYASTEKSITQTKARMPAQAPSKHPRKPSVKISSGDLDPAFERLDLSVTADGEGNPRFQARQFAPELGKGTNPHGYMGEHTDDRRAEVGRYQKSQKELVLAQVAQAIGKDDRPGYYGAGFSVLTIRGSDCRPRTDCPDWILNGGILVFIGHRLGSKFRACLEAKKFPPQAALDYAILTDYYRYRLTDAAIFHQYKASLRLEAMGKGRWTSSPNAVKNRRFRLVREGNALFGDRANILETQELLEKTA